MRDLEDDEPEPRRAAPWERADGEPDDSWLLFGRFALSDASTISAFARSEVPERSLPAVSALAARWRWRARRDALTWHLQREAVRGAVEESRSQGAAHARATAAALDWAVDSIAERRSRGEVLEPREAIAFLGKAIELQRLAAGEPTARVGIDLSKATEADLDRLEQALAVATGAAPAQKPAESEPLEEKAN